MSDNYRSYPKDTLEEVFNRLEIVHEFDLFDNNMLVVTESISGHESYNISSVEFLEEAKEHYLTYYNDDFTHKELDTVEISDIGLYKIEEVKELINSYFN